MQYFRNKELTELHNVSYPAVANWIKAAQKGKLPLQLYEQGGKYYIANTVKNQALIAQIVQKRKKYLNTRTHKSITPTPKFYTFYDREQILDIIYNIEVHSEIPFQYNYFDGGADWFDRYTNRLLNEETPNTLKSTIELLHSNLANIDRLLQGRQQVNVIDIGVGNAWPIKEVLEHLLKRGVLKRYIAIDISPEMLAIAERNIKQWFGGKITFEGHIRDITHERFTDLLAEDYLAPEQPVNLAFLLGGTLSNFRTPRDALNAIYNSLAPDDLLVHSLKLDTPTARRYFDFGIDSTIEPLSLIQRLTLDLLNATPDLYDVEYVYDEPTAMRQASIRPKPQLSIKFELDTGERVVELEKDKSILVWRAWHWTAQNVIDQFADAGFEALNVSQTSDSGYLLLIGGR